MVIPFLGASTFTWFIRALLVVALGFAGIWLKSRIDRSYEADALETRLDTYKFMFKHEQERHAQAEKDKADLAKLLFAAEGRTRTVIKTVTRDAVKQAPSSSDCDYDHKLTRLLNEARGYSN